MKQEALLRKQLIALLRSDEAHATFEQAVAGFPVDKAGIRPEGLPHSGWELLEHMRIAQNDILRFSISAEYEPMNWPKDYWPPSSGPPRPGDWRKSVDAFRADLSEFEKLLKDTRRDLFEPFPWGSGQTLLREAVLLADHNAYHVGQMVSLRRVLKIWSP